MHQEQAQSTAEPAIDFSILKTLEAKKADNLVMKKLYRQSSAFVCGMLFHFFSSSGSSLHFSLASFLLLQMTLIMLLETIESYAYTQKIDVSPRL